MPSDALVFESIAQSNIPAARKSAIRRLFEGMGGVSGAYPQRAVNHVQQAGHVFREGGEAILTGGLLGLIEAEHGSLDVLVRGKKVPIDGALAAVGLLGSILLANEADGIAGDVRHIGGNALAILTHRKTKAWREKGMAGPTGSPAHGENLGNEDPIVVAARLL